MSTIVYRRLTTSSLSPIRLCQRLKPKDPHQLLSTRSLSAGPRRIRHQQHLHGNKFLPSDHYRSITMASSESAVSAIEQVQLIEMAKKAAAFTAVKDHLDPRYKHVGIGSGSTVVYVVEAIKELHPEASKHMTFYPTGDQSKGLIKAGGLRAAPIEDRPQGSLLDVYFDGADEADADLNLIKGGGGCLWQEKIVAVASRTFVCIGDFRKLSRNLGTQWKQGIPIEVLPKAAEHVLAELERLGAHSPRLRSGSGKAGSVVTDNGMHIIDAPFTPLLLAGDEGGTGENGIWSVDRLAAKLKSLVGVCEIGLFYGRSGLDAKDEGGAQKPVAAYFGMADGSVQILNQGSPPVTLTTSSTGGSGGSK
ncbi:hypothetical protein MCOR25_004478 [Pyricularia grisea]|nr:hypothetical protein MCOR25_004478 [Pyricularia grisea]